MIIPTFVKLFAIKMVASNSFGLDKKFLINLALLDFSLLILTSSSGVRAKKETSAPEIKADIINNAISTIIEIILWLSRGFRKYSMIMFKKGVRVNVQYLMFY